MPEYALRDFVQPGKASAAQRTSVRTRVERRIRCDSTTRSAFPGAYGGQEQGTPVASVEDMKEALAAGSSAAKRSEIRVYPQAGHAFLADYRPSYEPHAAQDGWKRMLGRLKSHGV